MKSECECERGFFYLLEPACDHFVFFLYLRRMRNYTILMMMFIVVLSVQSCSDAISPSAKPNAKDLLTSHSWLIEDQLMDNSSLVAQGQFDYCMLDDVFFFTKDNRFFGELRGETCPYQVVYADVNYTLTTQADSVWLGENRAYAITKLTGDQLWLEYDEEGIHWTLKYRK